MRTTPDLLGSIEMNVHPTYTYPPTHDELVAAMARGRAIRSHMLLTWLSALIRGEEANDGHRTARPASAG